MTLHLRAIRLPRTLWQVLTGRSVWLNRNGGLELRRFPLKAALRWHSKTFGTDVPTVKLAADQTMSADFCGIDKAMFEVLTGQPYPEQQGEHADAGDLPRPVKDDTP